MTINRALPHIFCLLWVGQIASSECYAQDLPADSAVKVLQERIEHRFDVLDELQKDASFVVSIGKSLKHGERDGAMTYAIFLADTKNGKMAIKIYNPEHREEDLAMSLVLNHYLGELGLAPKLYGYLPRTQTAKILSEKLGRDSTDGSFSFAILMEVVDGAWHFKRDDYVPQELKTWDLAALVERIIFFQRTLNALRIKANDTQYLISRTGEIYLIDFDHFNWISPRNKLWGYLAPFTIQEEDFIHLQARYGDTPIPVKNDFLFDIEYLQRIFAENQ